MNKTPKLDVKREMVSFMDNFKGMPDRLLKYNEILLEGADASAQCYQDTMSYRRLAVALTTRCNLACGWCYRHDPQYKSILNQDLDIEKYRKFVRNTAGRFRMVHLAGLGEPTLYPKLLEVTRLSRRLSDNVKITTNGTILTCSVVDKLVDFGLTHIEISIDAFNEGKLKEYRGSDLNRLSDLVSYISGKTPLELQINSVVSSENHMWLIGMVRKFKRSKNIRVWHTIPLFKTAQMRERGIKPLDNGAYIRLLLRIEEAIKEEGLQWKLYPDAYGVRMDPVIEMKKRRNICFTCFEDPYINVKGRLNFCSRQEYSSVSDISVGFEKAWNHRSLLNYRKNMLNGIYPQHCGKLCFLKDRSAKSKGKV